MGGLGSVCDNPRISSKVGRCKKHSTGRRRGAASGSTYQDRTIESDATVED